MSHIFWDRIARCNPFKNRNPVKLEDDRELTLEEVHTSMSEEFRGLRKVLRKQSLLIEELRGRLEEPPEASRTDGAGEGLMQMAAAFFHLDQSLQDQMRISPQRREAVSLFWLQLEQQLDREDMQIIREQGVAFDARLHRAVLAREPGVHKSVVVQVLEPGFIERGKVRKPAKVILGPEDYEQETLEENRP